MKQVTIIEQINILYTLANTNWFLSHRNILPQIQ